MAKRVASIVVVLAALFTLHFALFRPWFLAWGADAGERTRALPGDQVVQNVRQQETRAITIHAPAREVFAWLAQLGQDRGGFYSYRVLENLAGCRMPDVDRLRPELQSWKDGDALWMYPKEKNIPGTGAPLVLHEPGRALVFATWQVGTDPKSAPPNGSWAMIVEPRGEHDARLILRGRGAAMDKSVLARAFDAVVFDPAHFVMERKMMTTIKARAEGGAPSAFADALEVASWTTLFAAFGVATAQALRGRRMLRNVSFAFLFGLAFQLLTFTQPGGSIAAGLTVVMLIFYAWRPVERPYAKTGHRIARA